MKERAIIALTLGPLALVLIFLGGFFYVIPLIAILTLATVEYTQLVRNMGWHINLFLLLVLVGVQWLLAVTHLEGFLPISLALSLLLLMAYALWTYEKQTSTTVPSDWMAAALGFLLLGWLGRHFFLLRGLDTIGMVWQWTMLAMLTTWCADSGAYIVGKFIAGRFIGRHQLSPRLSPNKTIEGYFGGVFFGMVGAAVSAILLQLPVSLSLILACFIAIVTPLGDLGISLLKREARVKDSGTIFRGHGGALDRIDTLIWAVTIAYYFLIFTQSI